MQLRSYATFCALWLLSGCVTGTPESVLTPNPTGQAAVAGQYPEIGLVPVGQTAQITPAEKAAIQAELSKDAQPGIQQQNPNAAADYKGEVDALRRLAREQQELLRKRIEGDSTSQ